MFQNTVVYIRGDTHFWKKMYFSKFTDNPHSSTFDLIFKSILFSCKRHLPENTRDTLKSFGF